MKALLIEDLKYLYSKLIKHPLFAVKEEERANFDALFCKLTGNITTYDAFLSAATRLTCFFHDGHTNIELPYLATDPAINLPCCWRKDKLLLAADYEDIGCGSEIVAIEGLPVKDLIRHMADRIPHENEYLVKSRMINYPYQNYHLFSGYTLKSLFGSKDRYSFRFLEKGNPVTVELSLEQYSGYLDFCDSNFVHYEIVGDTAVLHLDACICNEHYKNTLDELADICSRQSIKVLVLDLCKNMGGTSAVIDEFIKHTGTDTYRRYEMIDCSQGKQNYITRRTEYVKNLPYSKCFDLEIHCKVSHDTFSSARTFAVTLRDNGIASKITGSPTGGKPTSFGMPQRFKTPNYQVSFRVSQCLFLRPNAERDNDAALFPDDE